MLVKDIVALLNAREIYVDDTSIYQKNYDKGFATDLMSDALALLKNETEDILFITGLANVQSLRTAEVLDLETIMFVRGKPLDLSIIDMAKKLHINLFQTDEPMFEACGKLYNAGMRR
ncbi:hypothetical protein [uncultured Thomasclavelia sp.]|uniref:hypothetical protein n=1 Tax=uncultured Thomasclavelia sp. TaxID=3025759 RepID=UPI0025D28E7B|nr:hypothetical protein [uncultured Thomasclavelia sp.]